MLRGGMCEPRGHGPGWAGADSRFLCVSVRKKQRKENHWINIRCEVSRTLSFLVHFKVLSEQIIKPGSMEVL